MKRSVVIGLLLANALWSIVAIAGDAEAGKAKSAVCAACHGGAGVSTAPIYPNLAGQKEQYLLAQMKAFKDGTRSNPQMSPMVAALTDEDMANLAAYYAGLSCQ